MSVGGVTEILSPVSLRLLSSVPFVRHSFALLQPALVWDTTYRMPFNDLQLKFYFRPLQPRYSNPTPQKP